MNYTHTHTHFSIISDLDDTLGQSKRIWGELYKVIDSSDVVVQVLDARDPMGTRSRFVETHLKKNAPHKHLIFVLNKCDLIPTWATVCVVITIAIVVLVPGLRPSPSLHLHLHLHYHSLLALLLSSFRSPSPHPCSITISVAIGIGSMGSSSISGISHIGISFQHYKLFWKRFLDLALAPVCQSSSGTLQYQNCHHHHHRHRFYTSAG